MVGMNSLAVSVTRRIACHERGRDAAESNGGEGGIRTHVPVTRQDAFEAPPLRPLRYLSDRVTGARLGGSPRTNPRDGPGQAGSPRRCPRYGRNANTTLYRRSISPPHLDPPAGRSVLSSCSHVHWIQ